MTSFGSVEMFVSPQVESLICGHGKDQDLIELAGEQDECPQQGHHHHGHHGQEGGVAGGQALH